MRVFEFFQSEKQLGNVFGIFQKGETTRKRVFDCFQSEKQLENVFSESLNFIIVL